jgi:hypothetical protein
MVWTSCWDQFVCQTSHVYRFLFQRNLYISRLTFQFRLVLGNMFLSVVPWCHGTFRESANEHPNRVTSQSVDESCQDRPADPQGLCFQGRCKKPAVGSCGVTRENLGVSGEQAISPTFFNTQMLHGQMLVNMPYLEHNHMGYTVPHFPTTFGSNYGMDL